MDIMFHNHHISLPCNPIAARILIVNQRFKCLLILKWSWHICMDKFTLMCLLKESNSQATLTSVLTLDGCQNLRSLVLYKRKLMIVEHLVALSDLLLHVSLAQRLSPFFLSSSRCLLHHTQCLLLNLIQISLCLCPMNKELEAVLEAVILVQELVILSFQFTHQ